MRINNNIFNIGFGKFGEFLPAIFQKLDVFIFVYSFLRPWEFLHGIFTINRNDNIYKAEHNGQICYLRAALNDAFDVSLRRITIDDAPNFLPVVFYKRIEDNPVIFDTVAFSKRGYIQDTGFDFIVYCPAEYAGRGKRIQALINYYKLASKNYDIIFF